MMRKKEKRQRLIGAGVAMTVVAAVCSVVIRVNPVGAVAQEGRQVAGVDLFSEQAPELTVSAVSVPTVQANRELSSLTEQITGGNASIVKQAAQDLSEKQRQKEQEEKERKQAQELLKQRSSEKKNGSFMSGENSDYCAGVINCAAVNEEESEESLQQEVQVEEASEGSWEEQSLETASYEEESEQESSYVQAQEEPVTTEAASKSESSSVASSSASSSSSSSSSSGYSEAQYLQAICRIEAGTNYEGALAVANCVLNRLNAGYASSIYGVIYAPYQFDTSNMDYYLQNGCGSEVERAVNDALNGVNNVGSYRNFNGTFWLDPATLSCPYVVIGGNVFY